MSSNTSKVIRLHKTHDLRVESDPVQQPGAGEVLVKMGAGGICGSDLHYFHHGGLGDIRVIDPIILGHEVSGTVEQIGYGVTSVSVGDRIALNPSTPCNQCEYCQAGLQQHCLDMLFLGSAMRRPHVQGGFREYVTTPEKNCVKVSADTPLAYAALAEPLAVCLHAANRASGFEGAKVLVTGAGPIGSLCAAVAKYRGAAEVVVTDIETFTLETAMKMGATSTINVRESDDELMKYEAVKGHFDIAFECSGVVSALSQAIRVLRPQGTLVQVGSAGSVEVPFGRLIPREITIVGSFRFHEEFNTAVQLIDNGGIDVKPIISHHMPMDQARDAFELATDRSQAVKVVLEL